MKEFIVPKNISKDRMSICKSCDRFFKPTKQCKECLCFMFLKTKLSSSECPIGKWKSYV